MRSGAPPGGHNEGMRTPRRIEPGPGWDHLRPPRLKATRDRIRIELGGAGRLAW